MTELQNAIDREPGRFLHGACPRCGRPGHHIEVGDVGWATCAYCRTAWLTAETVTPAHFQQGEERPLPAGAEFLIGCEIVGGVFPSATAWQGEALDALRRIMESNDADT